MDHQAESQNLTGMDTPSDSMERVDRIVLIIGGTFLSILLTIALFLTPDPSGKGTHTQLGLPPCGFQLVHQIPCPACGMTTSWAWFVRGRIDKAVQANVGGTLLATICLLTAAWFLASGTTGRWKVLRPRVVWCSLIPVTAFAVVLLEWFIKIW